MNDMYRIGNKYIRYGIYILLIFSLLISVSTTASAITKKHGTMTSDTNDKCDKCHSNVHKNMIDKEKKPVVDKKNIGGMTSNSIISSNNAITTDVIGNIILIANKGQDWYQQGIYGPNGGYGGAGTVPSDNSWGWTFFDENPPSGLLTPPVNQRNNISALLLDDGNNSNPISGATVVADVTYWKYNGTNYTSNVISIPLNEDANHRGFYSGKFNFYGGTDYVGYDMMWCDGCHVSMYGGPDTVDGYFPGNYTVTIRASIGGKSTTQDLNFEVTVWGCDDCHGSGNRHTASSDMDSACHLCHSVNEVVGMGDPGNPHQVVAHRGINCIDCHTNKAIRNDTFNGVTFITGGFRNGQLPQYNYNVVALNGGNHSNLVCEDCHGNLTLADIPGGYNAERYTVSNTINTFDPSFANVEQFLDYYVIDVTSGGSLDISLDWEGTANLGFYLYPPNWDPRDDAVPLIYNGATFTNKPETVSIATPLTGKWILQVYGYDLGTDWIARLQPPISYTLNSTYPLEEKPLPKTPECNTCHNSGVDPGSGAYTEDNIPNWNPGFAHTDTNGDGNLDVQCRTCHDSMHNIGVKKCKDCHSAPPTGHMIIEPAYSQYTTSQCLLCHGDPHAVSAQAESCIECHGTNYTGASPLAVSTLVDIGLFNTSIHQNINQGMPAGAVTNDDCWMCHYNKDMNRDNVRKCSYCHSNASEWHGYANITTNLTELATK